MNLMDNSLLKPVQLKIQMIPMIPLIQLYALAYQSLKGSMTSLMIQSLLMIHCVQRTLIILDLHLLNSRHSMTNLMIQTLLRSLIGPLNLKALNFV